MSASSSDMLCPSDWFPCLCSCSSSSPEESLILSRCYCCWRLGPPLPAPPSLLAAACSCRCLSIPFLIFLSRCALICSWFSKFCRSRSLDSSSSLLDGSKLSEASESLKNFRPRLVAGPLNFISPSESFPASLFGWASLTLYLAPAPGVLPTGDTLGGLRLSIMPFWAFYSLLFCSTFLKFLHLYKIFIA